jgi:Putative adhesin
MYRRILALTLAAAPMLLIALEPKESATLHYSYPMQAGAKLTVDNFNGSIRISGWDQNTIDISVTKYAETQQLLAALKVDIAVAADGVHIRTIQPAETSGLGASYVIKVPRGVELAEIQSSNGSIHIDEIDGPANLRTSNGSVHTSKTRGKLEITTSNGSIDIQQSEGETDVRTSNGSVHASGIRGPVTATTSNGGMHVDLEESRGGPVTLTTTNGGVDLKLGSATQSAVMARTTNGPITLRMPASAGARVKAQTSHQNRVSSDFDIRKEGDNSESHLEGVVGSGGPTVDLTTSHGPIRLLKL